MYYYQTEGRTAASFLPDLPFPAAEEEIPALFLLRRDPAQGPAVQRLTDSRQLTAETVDVRFLDRTCRSRFKPPWPRTGSPPSTSATPAGGRPWTSRRPGPEKNGSTCWRWGTWGELSSLP